MKDYIGKYVIIRSGQAGVFAGTLEEKDGDEVRMSNVRRLWYWKGAASLSQMAVDGVKRPDECKFSVNVHEMIISDVIEIIPTTQTAEICIKGVKEWRI